MDPNEALKNWLEGAEQVHDATQALKEWLAGDGFAPRVKIRAVRAGAGEVTEYEGPWGVGVISLVGRNELFFAPDKGVPRYLYLTGMTDFVLKDELSGELVRVEIDG